MMAISPSCSKTEQLPYFHTSSQELCAATLTHKIVSFKSYHATLFSAFLRRIMRFFFAKDCFM